MAVHWQDGEPNVDWCFVGDEHFTDSFYVESISRHMRKPYNLLFRPQCDMSELMQLTQDEPCATPQAFIFHMSRCGSTLLKRMLGTLPAMLAISESPAIDQVLMAPRHHANLTEAEYLRWIRAIILATGRPRGLGTRHSVVKFDAWHCAHIGWIERAFPDVPWVMLIRDPLEVMVSCLSSRSANMLPGIGHLPTGLDLQQAFMVSAEEYVARMLADHLSRALAHADSPCAMVVNYRDLPDAALPAILAHLRLNVAPVELATMLTVAQRNAKQPSEPFVSDIADKQRLATDAIKHWEATLLRPLYEQLNHQAVRA